MLRRTILQLLLTTGAASFVTIPSQFGKAELSPVIHTNEAIIVTISPIIFIFDSHQGDLSVFLPWTVPMSTVLFIHAFVNDFTPFSSLSVRNCSLSSPEHQPNHW